MLVENGCNTLKNRWVWLVVSVQPNVNWKRKHFFNVGSTVREVAVIDSIDSMACPSWLYLTQPSSHQATTNDDGEGILSAAAAIASVAAGLEKWTLCIHHRYVAAKCAVMQKIDSETGHVGEC